MTTSTKAQPRESTTSSTIVRRPWWVVTRREVMVKLTDKSFLLSTFSMIALVIIGSVAGSLVGGSTQSSDYVLAISSPQSQGVADAAEGLVTADDSKDTLTINTFSDDAAARDAVAAEEADAALLLTTEGWTLVGRQEIPSELETAVASAVATFMLESNANAAGTSLTELYEGADVTTELLETTPEWAGMTLLVGGIFAFVFYFASILFGMAIANSVLEEKQNRVVEILATAIPIRQLLYGKVFGNSILAFVQIASYAVTGFAMIAVRGGIGDLDWLLGASGWFIVFFIAGFAALASIWAVLGSLASRSEDLQTNTGPITMIIMVAIVPGLFLKGVWLTVASYVPIVSAVAMPVRVLQEGAAVWEPYASLLVTVFAAYLLLRLGEKVYQRAVMQGGTALTWRQALKIET